MNRLLIAFKSLILSFAFILTWGWIALLISNVFDRYFQTDLPGWSRVTGIILMIIGGVIGLMCILSFIIKGNGTPAPFDAPKEFVSTGLYKYVRNPMYIGGVIILIGFGFYENSVSILIFSVVWILLSNVFIIYYEEPTLKKRFGKSYELYFNNVNRWLPKFKGYDRSGKI